MDRLEFYLKLKGIFEMKNYFNSYALSTLAAIGLGIGVAGDALADTVNFADNAGTITSYLEEGAITVTGSDYVFVTGGIGLGILGGSALLDPDETMSFYIDTVSNDVVIVASQTLDSGTDGVDLNATITAFDENGIELNSVTTDLDETLPIDISAITGATDIKSFDIKMNNDRISVGSISFTPIVEDPQLVELTFQGILDSDPTDGTLFDGDLSYSGSIVYNPESPIVFTYTGATGTVSDQWDVVSYTLHLAGETIEFPTNDFLATAYITDSITNTSDGIGFTAFLFSELAIDTNILNNLSIRVGSFGLGSAFSGAGLEDISTLYVDGPLVNQDVAISFEMDGEYFDLRDADEQGNNGTFVSFADYNPVTNEAPTSNAGVDQLAIVGDTVTLDGSESTDPENDVLSYSWALSAPDGSNALLIDADTASPSFVPDIAGDYSASLVVSDLVGPGEADVVDITASTLSNFVETQILEASDAIDAMDVSNFAAKGHKNALSAHFIKAIKDIQKGNLESAFHTLEDALSRTDGCILNGAVDGEGESKDWVTDCPAQEIIYPAIDAAVQALAP